MTKFVTIRSAFCALLVSAAIPAAADVTPADVWSAFRDQLAGYARVTADEAQSGDTLTVSNIVMRTQVEEATSSVTLSEPIVFRALGDGTVAIDLPASLTARMALSGDASENATIGYVFTQQGMQIIASGTPENILHEFSAPQMTYTLSDFQVDGAEMGGNMTIGMTGAAGTWRSTNAGDQTLEADYKMDAMSIKGGFSDPNGGDGGQIDAQLNTLDVTSSYVLPAGFADLAPERILSSGFAAATDLSFDNARFAAAVTSEGTTTNIEGTMGDGAFDVAADGDTVRYATSTNDLVAQGLVSGLPFPPVEVRYDRSSFDFEMPLSKSDAPRDFRLGAALQGLAVSDFVWAMIDPAQQLPRDPADVVVDIDGKGNWLVDILDPDVAQSVDDKAPGALESVTLRQLQVKIAGAELTGTGDFSFDNTDLKTFNGIPRPIGGIDLALTGGITLLDKLVSMNLVPQQQAMGIKMMSGMFAKPGPAPDTLTSKIEIDPSGKISANGVPLQ